MVFKGSTGEKSLIQEERRALPRWWRGQRKEVELAGTPPWEVLSQLPQNFPWEALSQLEKRWSGLFPSCWSKSHMKQKQRPDMYFCSCFPKYSFVHSFLHHYIFIECLPYARLCATYWGCSNKLSPWFYGGVAYKNIVNRYVTCQDMRGAMRKNKANKEIQSNEVLGCYFKWGRASLRRWRLSKDLIEQVFREIDSVISSTETLWKCFLYWRYPQILLHWKSENVVPNWKQKVGAGRPRNDKQKRIVSFDIRQSFEFLPCCVTFMKLLNLSLSFSICKTRTN